MVKKNLEFGHLLLILVQTEHISKFATEKNKLTSDDDLKLL